jgi:ribosomal RNA assembly protein
LSFEQVVKIPVERVGVVVGKNGAVKSEIEKECQVELVIDSKSGEVVINTLGDVGQSNPFKAIDIVTAIGKGFSPERAMRLLAENMMLTIIDLREYSGKSENAIVRLKGRIIGFEGKARRLIEELTGALISVFGHFAAIIGDPRQSKVAQDAIVMLATGSNHKTVYNMLQREKTKIKLEKLQLWESQRPPEVV